MGLIRKLLLQLPAAPEFCLSQNFSSCFPTKTNRKSKAEYPPFCELSRAKNKCLNTDKFQCQKFAPVYRTKFLPLQLLLTPLPVTGSKFRHATVL